MNKWMYRVAMTLLLANLALCVYMVATQPVIVAQCIDGLVMVPSKDRTMYVQRAVFVAERCIPIDMD